MDTPPDLPEDPTHGAPLARRVLLIGWDGADWRMIDPLIQQGAMPNFKRLLDEGVRGNIATLQPMLSPMLWTAIATGKHADRHGVLGFAEPDPKTGKGRPVTSSTRRCKALWNILTDAGRPSGVVNWYATHPAELINGFVVSDRFAVATGVLQQSEPHDGWPPVPGSVHPAEDLDSLANARIHPMMISPDQVRELVPSATDEECFTDPKLREVRVLLAHCATVHNAATAFLDARPWDFLGVYYDAIDRFAHAFMEYNPPRMAHVGEVEFERYKMVMEGVYRLHDMMLGRVMKLIDADTAVIICSDHGFFSDQRRPEGSSTIQAGKPVAWHRTYGMVALWGPGMKQGEQIHGATLLDITPTVLRMLGMPVARDMEGRPLVQAFEAVGQTMPSRETYENGASHLPPADTADDESTRREMMRQLRDLGYVGDDDASDTEIDQLRNLGTVYLSTGRPRLALEQFRRVLDAKPEDKGGVMSVVTALLQMGRLDECEEALDQVVGDAEVSPRAALVRALVKERRGDLEGATTIVEELLLSGVQTPGLLGQIGRMYLHRDKLNEAEKMFVRALDYEPEDPEALDCLGVVYRRTGRAPEAVLAHVRSLALMRHRPQAHLNLARALLDAGRVPWALESCRIAARMSPQDPTPHELLAEAYAERVGNKEKAAFHRGRAVTLWRRRKRQGGKRLQTTIAEPKGEKITVVTGLPRSGTSLLMQMLEAGGLPALTDGRRESDADNPRGYYELEAVRRTSTDDSWLDGAGGCCVKVVTAMLRALPDDREYRVIFMRRDINEVLASQAKMLDRLGRSGAALDTAELRKAFEEDLHATQAWLTGEGGMRVLEVWYDRVVIDAASEAERIAEFLGEELEQRAMTGVVDERLYRQRATRS